MRINLLVSSVLSSLLLLGGCSDGSDSRPKPPEPPSQYDFSAVDDRFQQFLDESVLYDGISYTLVDIEQGVVHEVALGDHTLDIVVLLASASKMPAAALLMALDDDESLDFDVEATIDNYLPWDGVYGDRTAVQLLSNTSGIPGLASLASYGPHLCVLDTNIQLEVCAELIYTNEIPGTVPAGSKFDYGGSQWQLAGGLAEQVSNSSWRQAFDRYIAEPCDLEVFQFGNMGFDWDTLGIDVSQWTGHPDSLIGLDNPLIEGGAISNMQDYGKLLLMQLRGGQCGDNRVMSQESVEFMQVDRSGELTGIFSGFSYGMGWAISQRMPGVILDIGLFGSVGWLDIERGIGGYIAVDDYSRTLVDFAIDPFAPTVKLLLEEIILLQQQAVDEARSAAGQ